MYFLEWKFLYFDFNVIKDCSKGSNWQYVSIGSGNDFAPTFYILQGISKLPRHTASKGHNEQTHDGLMTPICMFVYA